jgi:hypothetical protein
VPAVRRSNARAYNGAAVSVDAAYRSAADADQGVASCLQPGERIVIYASCIETTPREASSLDLRSIATLSLYASAAVAGVVGYRIGRRAGTGWSSASAC